MFGLEVEVTLWGQTQLHSVPSSPPFPVLVSNNVQGSVLFLLVSNSQRYVYVCEQLFQLSREYFHTLSPC